MKLQSFVAALVAVVVEDVAIAVVALVVSLADCYPNLTSSKGVDTQMKRVYLLRFYFESNF